MNNTLKRLLSLAMAVVLVMTCGVMPVSADEGESSEHSHVYVEGLCECGATCDHAAATVTETAPTCAEPGAKTSTCGTCGMTLSTEAIPATGAHVYDEATGECVCGAKNPNLPAEVDDEEEETHTCNFSEEVSDTATCTAPGVKTMKCACGETQEVESPAKGHAYGDGTVTTEPTCAASGVLTKTCGCGETTTETIPATGNHNYVNGVCTVCTAAEPVVCDGTENCPADEHNEDCLCYDWCIAHGCDQDNGIHLEGCPYTIPCPTEGCKLHKGHWGDCTGMDTFEGKVVAKIGDSECGTLADALNKASAMTGDVTVEIYDKVTLNTSLSGSYSSIKFVGMADAAEIYLDVQGYITAHGKTVSFEDLILSKSTGGYIGNAGFMNVAFGIYDVTEVTYTNCTFANGAYASSGNVTFNNCTFKRSYDKYGLWAYGNVNCTVNGGKFDDYRGIKMYAEGRAKTTALTVNGVDFTAVSDKPAIVLTFGKSVTLTGENKFPSTGVFELDTDGAPNGTPVTANIDDIACVYEKNKEMLDCGVLVDGKIYTTITDAKDIIKPDSTVTLMYETEEEVSLPYGVTLNKNGNTAANVTISVLDTEEELKAAIAKGGTITLEGDITLTDSINITEGMDVTIQGESKTITAAEGKDAFYVTGGKLTLASGLNVVAPTDCCIYIRGGEVITSANLTKNGTKYSAIQGNGQYVGDVTINGGTIINNVTDGCAIYWPQNGKLTINGGSITGGTGIRLTSGSLEITNGTITATGTKNAYVPANGASVVDTGDALMIEAIGGTSGYEIPSSVSVAGGTFNGSVGSYAANGATPITGFITDGIFNTTLPTNLIKLGYKQVNNTIVEDTVTAEVEAPKAEIDPTVTISPADKNSITESTVNNSETVTSTITAAVDSSVVNSMVDSMNTNGATDAIVTMQIKLVDTDTAEDSTSASASIEKLTYDIHPIVQTVQITNKGEEDEQTKVIDTEKVENDDIKAPITFRIPIPASVTATYAYLTHEGNPMGLYEIKTENGQKYIECSSDNFSEFTVEPANDVNADTTMVAQIGTAQFATLEKAIEDAASGNTITLLTDVTPASTLTIPTGKTVTIDLNGNDIKAPSSGNTIEVVGNLTVKDSNPATNPANAIHGTSGSVAPVTVKGGTFTLESGNLNGSNYGLRVEGGTATVKDGAINVSLGEGYGVYVKQGTLNVNGGIIAGQQMGIAGNGYYDDTTINITDGTVTAYGIAIYHPQAGALNISGGEISGATGVYVKGGNVSVTGGTINGTGAKTDYNGADDGANSTGDAIVVENRGGNYGTPAINVTGGNFVSTNAAPITSYAASNLTASTEFVSGGSFSGAVPMSNDVVVESKRVPENTSGTYTLETPPTSTDANGNTVYYDDLDDMLSKNVAKITLNANETLKTDHTLTTDVNINVGTYGIYGSKTLTTDNALTINDMGTKDTDIRMPDGGTAKLNAAGSSVFTPGDCSFGYSKISVNGKDYFNEDAGANVTVAADGSVTFNGDFISVSYDEKGNIVYTMRKVEDKESKSNVFYYGSDSRMLFVSDGFSYLLSSVYVDDKPIAESNYIVEDGSTHVTLRNSFLRTLTKGTHTLTMKYEDGGYATCNFYVKTQSVADETNPKTGDFILMPMAIMTLSAAALAVLLISKKKHA